MLALVVLLSGSPSNAQSVGPKRDRGLSIDVGAPLAVVLTVAPETQEWSALLHLANHALSRHSYFLLRVKQAAVEPIGECSTEMSCKLLLARSSPPVNTASEVETWIESTIASSASELHQFVLVVDRSIRFTNKVSSSFLNANRMPLGRFSDVIHFTRDIERQRATHPLPLDQIQIRSAPRITVAGQAEFTSQLSAIDISNPAVFTSNATRPFNHTIDKDSKGQASSADAVVTTESTGAQKCALAGLFSAATTVSTDSRRVDPVEQVLSCYKRALIGENELLLIGKQWFEEDKDSQIIDLTMKLSRNTLSLQTALTILYSTVLKGPNLCSGQSLITSLFQLSGHSGLDPKTAATFSHCNHSTSNETAHTATPPPVLTAQNSVVINSKNDSNSSVDSAGESTNRVREASLDWLRQTSVNLTFIGDMSLLLKDIAPKCKHCSSIVEDIAFHSIHARNSVGDKEFLSDLMTVQIALLTAKELGFLAFGNGAPEPVLARNSDQLCRASSFWDSVLCSKGANSDFARVRFKKALYLLMGKNAEELLSSIAEKGYIVVQAKEHSVSIKTALLNRLIGTLSMTGYSRERRLLEVLNSDIRSSLTLLISGVVPFGGIDSAVDLVLDADDIPSALAQFMDTSHFAVMNWLLSLNRRDSGTTEEVFKQTQTPCSLSQRNLFKCLLKLPLDAQRKLWMALQLQNTPNGGASRPVPSKDSESAIDALNIVSPFFKLVRLELHKCIQEGASAERTTEERIFRADAAEAYEAVLRTLSPASFVVLRKIVRLSAYDGCADKRILRALQLISMSDWRRVDIAAFAVVMIGKIEDDLTMDALDNVLAKVISLTDTQVVDLMKTLACAHCGAFIESERRDLSTFFIETIGNIPENDRSYRVDFMTTLSRLLGRRRGPGIGNIVSSCLSAHSWASVWLDDLLVIDIDRSVKGLAQLSSHRINQAITDGRIVNRTSSLSLQDASLQNLETPIREPAMPSALDLESLAKILDLEVVSDGKSMAQRHESSAFADLAIAGARNLQGSRYWNDADYAYNSSTLPFTLELLQWRCLQSKDLEHISVGLLIQSFRSNNVRIRNEAGADSQLHQNSIARFWIAHLNSILPIASEDALFKLLSFLIWRRE
jgi:hypothetical protein